MVYVSLPQIDICAPFIQSFCKASLVHYSSKLKCGVANFGIANFVTFLENTDPVRRADRRFEYGDESDPRIRAFLERISPLYNADKISVPLFITHGEVDTEVLVHESVSMYKIVQGKLGEQVQLVICEDEGHGKAQYVSCSSHLPHADQSTSKRM